MSSMTRFGYITADDTETQINNLSTEITVIGSNLSSHVASSTVHGIQNGSVVVGTTEMECICKCYFIKLNLFYYKYI